MPLVDNTYNVGTPSNAFQNVYVNGVIHATTGSLGLQADAVGQSIYASCDAEHFDLISYNGAVSPSIRLGDTGGTNYVGIKAPASVSSSYTVAMPAAQGGANTFVKNDGSGNL